MMSFSDYLESTCPRKSDGNCSLASIAVRYIDIYRHGHNSYEIQYDS